MIPVILPVGDLSGACGWDGGEWRRIKVTTEGALVLQTYGIVFDWTATSNVTYVDVTGLDIQSHWGYWIYLRLYNPQASDTNISMYVNGDYTDTNYYQQYLLADGTTVSANRSNNALVGSVFAGTCLLQYAFLTIYPTGQPILVTMSGRRVGASLGTYYRAWNYTVAVSNITSLRFASSVAGGIGTGSKILIYRLK
jgi:hypothetical protein